MLYLKTAAKLRNLAKVGKMYYKKYLKLSLLHTLLLYLHVSFELLLIDRLWQTKMKSSSLTFNPSQLRSGWRK